MIGKRFAAVAVAVLLSIGVAAAPSAAEGDEYSVPERGSLEFVPASNPLNVTADSAHIIDLNWVAANTPIRLANGKMSSSNTTYLRFQYLTADTASITQNVSGRSLSLTNLNGGDPATAARLGSPGSTLDVWTEVVNLDVCITAETLNTIIDSYASQFGAQLDEARSLVTKIFEPFDALPSVGLPSVGLPSVGQPEDAEPEDEEPSGRAGPCVPFADLMPLLTIITQAGVPLPDDLPVENLVLRAYAVNIAAPRGTNTLSLPVAEIAVENA